jgi:16S rRNA (guanine527-N7)-methyltransferase
MKNRPITDNMLERLKTHFPWVEPAQWLRLAHMAALHREWNARVNLVSRKDIEYLEWHHYAPCVAVSGVLRLMDGARVLDAGTGGGFPGLIMAVLYPGAHFTLVDSVGKKITAVAAIAAQLKLRNVETCNRRVEQLHREFDFVTGRAVASLPQFVQWVRRCVRKGGKHSWENGILYWKGGSLADEAQALGIQPSGQLSLEETLGDAHFHEKYILHYRQPDLARAKPPALTND